jgi:hypothetical protein
METATIKTSPLLNSETGARQIAKTQRRYYVMPLFFALQRFITLAISMS